MPSKQYRQWCTTIYPPSTEFLNDYIALIPPSLRSSQETAKSPHPACIDLLDLAKRQNLADPPTDTRIQQREARLLLFQKMIRFWISGLEHCPTTNRIHLQCYFETLEKMTITGVKSFLFQLFNIHPHFEAKSPNSTPQQCVDYSLKDDTLILEYGVMAQASQKVMKESEQVTQMILSGASLKKIAQAHPEYYMRCSRGIKELKSILSAEEDYDVPRDFRSQVKVYIGPTGCGKSHYAKHEDKATWTHSGDRWFDGYQGQEVVLFDDFEGIKSGIPYRKLLQLTDCYSHQVPVKNSFANWRPRVIIFTTNVEPSSWYPDEADTSHLLRRIATQIRFHPGEYGRMTYEKGVPLDWFTNPPQ